MPARVSRSPAHAAVRRSRCGRRGDAGVRGAAADRRRGARGRSPPPWSACRHRGGARAARRTPSRRCSATREQARDARATRARRGCPRRRSVSFAGERATRAAVARRVPLSVRAQAAGAVGEPRRDPRRRRAAVRRGLSRGIARSSRRRTWRAGRSGPTRILVEDFVPGAEVALEGLLERRRAARARALRQAGPARRARSSRRRSTSRRRGCPRTAQDAIARVHRAGAARARPARRAGPRRAARATRRGPWLIEIAARSIGGLCSRTLRFGTGHVARGADPAPRAGAGDRLVSSASARPAGVMMIPIPRGGMLEEVRGARRRRARCPHIEDVTISAHHGQDARAAAGGLALSGLHLLARDRPRRGGGGPARGPSPSTVRDPLDSGRRRPVAQRRELGESRHEHRAGVRARLQPAGRRGPGGLFHAGRQLPRHLLRRARGGRRISAPCSSGCSARAATTPGPWRRWSETEACAAAEWTFAYVVSDAIPRSAGRKVRFRA